MRPLKRSPIDYLQAARRVRAGEPPGRLARELGVSVRTIYRWVARCAGAGQLLVGGAE